MFIEVPPFCPSSATTIPLQSRQKPKLSSSDGLFRLGSSHSSPFGQGLDHPNIGEVPQIPALSSQFLAGTWMDEFNCSQGLPVALKTKVRANLQN